MFARSATIDDFTSGKYTGTRKILLSIGLRMEDEIDLLKIKTLTAANIKPKVAVEIMSKLEDAVMPEIKEMKAKKEAEAMNLLNSLKDKVLYFEMHR